MNFDKAFEVLNILNRHGHEARIIGGAVRDKFMNRPVNDIDIATTALPDTIISIFESNGYQVIPTGLQHGTVTVVYQDETFEVTTLRLDVETDGRHAKVEFTNNWEADAKRRDLTFNAMSMDLSGHIFDYFGGKEDAEAKYVRFIGNPEDRIREDYLRLLRYFRFCADLDSFHYNQTAFDAIQRNAVGLNKISRERIIWEMMKITQRSKSSQVFNLMNTLGVSEVIFGKELKTRKYVNMGIEDWELTLRSMGVKQYWFVEYKGTTASINKIQLIQNIKLSLEAGDSLENLHYTFGHENMAKAAEFYDLPIWMPQMNIPKRPFDGFMIMKRFPLLTGKAIGKRLHDMTIKWCDSGFTKTFEKLAQGYK